MLFSRKLANRDPYSEFALIRRRQIKKILVLRSLHWVISEKSESFTSSPAAAAAAPTTAATPPATNNYFVLPTLLVCGFLSPLCCDLSKFHQLLVINCPNRVFRISELKDVLIACCRKRRDIVLFRFAISLVNFRVSCISVKNI